MGDDVDRSCVLSRLALRAAQLTRSLASIIALLIKALLTTAGLDAVVLRTPKRLIRLRIHGAASRSRASPAADAPASRILPPRFASRQLAYPTHDAQDLSIRVLHCIVCLID
jgi:hypothetical protein